MRGGVVFQCALMRRREFFLRSAALLAGLLLPRRGGSQLASLPDPLAPAAGDSTSTDSRAGAATAFAPSDTAGYRPAAEWNVMLAAAGDTTLGYNLEAHVDDLLCSGFWPEQVWPLYSSGVRAVLDAADLSLVNLECPFTDRGEKLLKNFNFRARRELVAILEAASIDLVTLANNHLMDFGPEGLEDTIATLEGAGIGYFGAGRNLLEARRPRIVERGGLRLGFVGYYFQAPPDMLEPEAVYATRRRPGVAGCYQDLQAMRAQVTQDLTRLVRKVDVAIPFFHWGKEGSYEVRDYQIELAHRCIDLGARAVLGAHPHRLQGIEVYKGAPIFYSLGNFIFGGNKDPEDKLSMIARLKIARSGVVESDVVPIQVTRWPEAPFQPFVLEGDARGAALVRIAGLSLGFARTLPELQPAG
jgi:poly-gamma-glutamate capsule biosynthesis protein CapA/YwtB (metallophosphatase superfamily)